MKPTSLFFLNYAAFVRCNDRFVSQRIEKNTTYMHVMEGIPLGNLH